MNYLRTPLFWLLMGWLICLPLANANDNIQSRVTLESLKERVRTISDEHKLPSVAYALVDKDQIETIEVIGMADVASKRVANQQTLYRIGSISKMFSSLAILTLVEQGRLHLDDEVAFLVPEVAFTNPWQDTHPIRVVHLLEHTTGWDNLALKELAKQNTADQSLADSLAFYPESRTSRWPPGTRTAYSNSGVAVAAIIVEKITGQLFEEYVKNTIFKPLNMGQATYSKTKAIDNMGATSYLGSKAQPYKHLIYRPAGAVNASIAEMARFTQFFLQRGTPILAPVSIERMERSESTNAGRVEIAHGLDNSKVIHGPWVYYGHDGSVNGALAELRYMPKAGVGFVVLLNSNDQQAKKKIIEAIVSYQTQALSKPNVNEQASVTSQKNQLNGYYYTINSGFELAHGFNRLVAIYKVKTENSNLSINGLIFGKTENKLQQVSDTSYRSVEHGMIELTVANDPIDGQVLHYKDKVLYPTSAFSVYGQLIFVVLWFVALLSSVLVIIISGICRLFGKKASAKTQTFRLWPMLASVSSLVFLIALALGMRNPIVNLGGISLLSVTIFLTTITFAGCSLIAVYKYFTMNRSQIGKITLWYYSGCLWIHLIVACYFFIFGVIGLRIWG